MKLFGLPASTYLRALWSGRIGHWAGTNDAVLNETAKRIEALQDPLRMIFLELLLACNATAEQLVGYQHNFRLLAPDQNVLSIEHFRRLYSTLLSYFAVAYYTVNPFLREPLLSELPRVAPDGQVVEKYVRDAGLKEQEYGDNLSPWLGTSYLETLETLAWQHLAEGFPGVDSSDIGRLAGFKLVVSQAAIVSFSRIKAQMLNAASRAPLQQAGHRNAKKIDSGGESGEQDQALQYIAARIEPLQGLDRRFAARMLQAAWEIIQKFSDIPGADFAERFAAASPEDSVKAYKAILGQLFFTFFLPDANARKAASRLLTDTTDEDLEHTIRIWEKFEECLNGEGASADPRFNTAAIGWKSACEAIGADPSAEPVALLCFVVPWDAAMSELRREFKAQRQMLNATSRTPLQQAGAMARPTTVACWSCKAELEVTPETAGKKVRCAQCGMRQALPC